MDTTKSPQHALKQHQEICHNTSCDRRTPHSIARTLKGSTRRLRCSVPRPTSSESPVRDTLCPRIARPFRTVAYWGIAKCSYLVKFEGVTNCETFLRYPFFGVRGGSGGMVQDLEKRTKKCFQKHWQGFRHSIGHLRVSGFPGWRKHIR